MPAKCSDSVNCKACGLLLRKIEISKKLQGGWDYKDERGHRWYGATCGKCYDEKRRLRGHALGKHKPREEISHRTFSKAVHTELLVKRFYEEMGFTVEHTKGKGPDLVCSKNGATFNVEVKAAIHLRGKRQDHWRISPVKKNRVNDDFVAIVLPGDRILIEPMSERLRKGLMLTNDIKKVGL